MNSARNESHSTVWYTGASDLVFTERNTYPLFPYYPLDPSTTPARTDGKRAGFRRSASPNEPKGNWISRDGSGVTRAIAFSPIGSVSESKNLAILSGSIKIAVSRSAGMAIETFTFY
jgi:hypothetical protein